MSATNKREADLLKIIDDQEACISKVLDLTQNMMHARLPDVLCSCIMRHGSQAWWAHRADCDQGLMGDPIIPGATAPVIT